jgi:hypothetical protein
MKTVSKSVKANHPVSSHSQGAVLGDADTAEAEEEAMEAATMDRRLMVTSTLTNSQRKWRTGASAWENGARRWQKSTSKEVRRIVRAWTLKR